MTAPATIAVSAPTPATTPVLLTGAFAGRACAATAHPDRRDAVHHRVAGIAGEGNLMLHAAAAGSRKALR